MDVRELAFENGTFDVAIDKGIIQNLVNHFLSDLHQGTMDAMMTAKGDVWVQIFVSPIYSD